jgi:protein-tyrosine phosphatase
MRSIPPHSLWIGHAGDSHDVPLLLERGVQAVVQLAVEEAPLALPREIAVCRFPLADGGENDPRLLLLAIRAVTQLVSANVPTLVCCNAGLSRAPAIVAAALAEVHGQTLHDSLTAIARQTPTDVSPQLWRQIEGVVAGQRTC